MGRPEDNQALKDLDELVSAVLFLDLIARPVLVRNRFSSGQRVHHRGELAEMEGTPPPHYSDPTGDSAVWNEEMADGIGKTLRGLARVVSGAGSLTHWLIDLADTDVVKRAERTIPNCLACGDACLDRVYAGLDPKCYQRWIRAGRPDRAKFIADTQADRVSEEIADD